MPGLESDGKGLAKSQNRANLQNDITANYTIVDCEVSPGSSLFYSPSNGEGKGINLHLFIRQFYI